MSQQRTVKKPPHADASAKQLQQAPAFIQDNRLQHSLQDHRAHSAGQMLLQKLSEQTLVPGQARVSNKSVTQLKPMAKMVTGLSHLVELVDGHLYNENYQSNERTEITHGAKILIDTDVRYRSRRGPNQEKFSETDEQGPQHYLWYLVKSVDGKKQPDNYFVREDVITHPLQEKALAVPLQSTFYGTDGSNAEEVAKAYKEGYTDFDCAFSYHGGSSYMFLRKAEIDTRRPVRVVYKFKLAEADNASNELSKMSRTPGVIIHTIMLHEVPESTSDVNTALEHLALLGLTHQCRVGVSNVPVTEIPGSSDLVEIRKALIQKGIDISVVENKMNPSVPDQVVREYCLRNGLQYIAYGLTGPSSAGGTCGMVPGSGDGDYMVLSDPGLLALAKKIGIQPSELRYVIYTWARKKHVSIITRSSQKDRRLKNRVDFEVQPVVHDVLDTYGQTKHEIGLYLPMYRYLISQGVAPNVLQQLVALIPPDWLERYYHKAIVDFNDDKLTAILKDSALFGKLQTTIGAEKWKDITAMRTYFMQLPNQTSVLSQTATSEELIAMLGEFGAIFDEMFSKITTVNQLNQQQENAIVRFQEVDGVSEYVAYKKQKNASWKKV